MRDGSSIVAQLNRIKLYGESIFDVEPLVLTAIGLHDQVKHIDYIGYLAKKEGNEEVLKLVEETNNKLKILFREYFRIVAEANKELVTPTKDEILKKYAHNIPAIIKNNNMILTLANGIDDKNLLGNKGANLVKMHKLGIRIPQSLFLTTENCKKIREAGKVEFYPLLKQLFNMFTTDKIAIRSSGVISMAGMMDTVLDIDKNDEQAVCKAIMDVVASWDSERAKQFRKISKIDDEIKLAIVIQPVIRGDKGFSGICFSRDVNTGKPNMTGEFVKGQLGDNLASGKVTPEKLENSLGKFPNYLFAELNEMALKLEKHFKAVQDVEFVVDEKELYIVQTRNAKLSALASVKTLIDFYNVGMINKDEFKTRFNPKWLDDCTEYRVMDSQGFLFKGTGAVNGYVTGQVVFDSKGAEKYENPILLADITTPDDLPLIQKVKGLVSRIGGFASHPAVICRELNKPCVIGVDSLKIIKGENRAEFIIKGKFTETLCEGDTITIVGNTGEVWMGGAKVEIKVKYQDEVTEIMNS
jgi:phosphoenolpyruvate synthase/pyruvate phosphate dikinase